MEGYKSRHIPKFILNCALSILNHSQKGLHMRNKMIKSAISAVLVMGVATIAVAETNNNSMQMSGNIEGMEKCFGIAKAGQNDCATASHSCAGESKTDRDKEAWINVPTGVCNKIAGSSTKSPEKV